MSRIAGDGLARSAPSTNKRQIFQLPLDTGDDAHELQPFISDIYTLRAQRIRGGRAHWLERASPGHGKPEEHALTFRITGGRRRGKNCSRRGPIARRPGWWRSHWSRRYELRPRRLGQGARQDI